MRNDAILLISLALLTGILVLLTLFNSNDEYNKSIISRTEDNNNLKGNIEFMCNKNNGKSKEMDKISSKFTKKYENSEVTINQIDDYNSAMKIRMNSNDLPDIWIVENGIYLDRAIEKYCVNLTKNLPEISKKFEKNCAIKSSSNDIYAIPIGLTTYMMIYNKKIFSNLKLETPSTYSELLQICKKIKKEEIIPFGSVAGESLYLEYLFSILPKLITNDSEALNKIINDKNPLNSESSVYKSYAIFKYFNDHEFIETNPLESEFKKTISDFKSGKIAMMYLNSTYLPDIINNDFGEKEMGVFLFPYSEEKDKFNVLYEPFMNLAISKNTKNLDLSKKWLEYFLDESYHENINSIGIESTRDKIFNSSFYFKDIKKTKAKTIPHITNSDELKDFLISVNFSKEKIISEIIDGNSLKNIFWEYNEKWNELNKTIND
ncbi:MAG: extracellular solute-binding protein [Clostridiales bacterium]